MKLPQACFESVISEATRRCRHCESKYIAKMYKKDNGTFDIKYKRVSFNGFEYEAYPHEVCGFDDWTPSMSL